MMKNAFYFILKALLVLQIFKFMPGTSVHVEKQLDQKDMINFKFYDVTTWLTYNYNKDIAQYFKKSKQLDNEIWSVNRI